MAVCRKYACVGSSNKVFYCYVCYVHNFLESCSLMKQSNHVYTVWSGVRPQDLALGRSLSVLVRSAHVQVCVHYPTHPLTPPSPIRPHPPSTFPLSPQLHPCLLMVAGMYTCRCPVSGADLIPDKDLENIIYMTLCMDEGTSQSLQASSQPTCILFSLLPCLLACLLSLV